MILSTPELVAGQRSTESMPAILSITSRDREPRDSRRSSQRFSGICTTGHAITSVRAVENAPGRQIPLDPEASLLGNPVADSERPLEVVRTVHSFDPCLACAIHALDPEGHEIAKVQAL